MGQLNLRGVDDELIRLVKATAASEGMTIPQFVCGVLERDLKRGGWTAPPKVEQPTAQRLTERILSAQQNPAPYQSEAKETVYERDEYSQ